MNEFLVKIHSFVGSMGPGLRRWGGRLLILWALMESVDLIYQVALFGTAWTRGYLTTTTAVLNSLLFRASMAATKIILGAGLLRSSRPSTESADNALSFSEFYLCALSLVLFFLAPLILRLSGAPLSFYFPCLSLTIPLIVMGFFAGDRRARTLWNIAASTPIGVLFLVGFVKHIEEVIR